MIEYICDKCKKRIDHPPEVFKNTLSVTHICRDCIVGGIREYAKKIADAPLGYAPYEQLICIYQNISGAYINARDIKTPWDPPKCHVCGSEMRMSSPTTREYFCEKCMAIYDRFGNKIRDGPMDCDEGRICPKCGKVMILCEDEKTYYQIWECDGCGYKEED